jgi:hypothetical protein
MCASFVAGAATAWLLREPAVIDVVPNATSAPTEVAERPVQVTRTAADRSCGEAVAECEHAREFYRAQLIVYEGVPQAWPAGVPGAFTEAPLRDVLARSFDGQATVNEMDCAEYPCIALVALTSDDQSCCAQLEELLPDPVRQKVGGANFYQTEEGRMVAAIAFGARAAWNADIEKRSTWRLQQMVDEAQDR